MQLSLDGGPVAFGVNVSPAIDADPVGQARRAEDLGFDFVSVNDHLHGAAPRHETWTLLTWIAAATSDLRVASRVLAVPYRHPPVLAKMAETLHRLSGGRLILGLGGGASDEEFAAFGLPPLTPRDKVDGLEEATRILRGLWTERELTFEGRIHRTAAARVEPKPDRPIPLWLGTYGPRALEVTGRLADGWIPTYELAPPARVPEMRERILEAARRAGRSSEDITRVYNLDVRVEEGARSTPSTLAGSPAAVAQALASFRGLGFAAFNLVPEGPDVPGQVERLGREVLPAVRGEAG